jgi:outer membrane receptor for ferrienterochelin and colicins
LQGLSVENTMILIDGIALVGRSASNPNLISISKRHWTPRNCKKISSSLSGSEALGGGVNSITKKYKWEGFKDDVDYFIRAASADC